MVLQFDGGLEFDADLYEVRRDGTSVPLEPQAFDVLAYLVAHRDRVVAKEELMDAVWGGRFVSETAVSTRIKQIRRAIGDDGHSQRIIRTVHGRGYRFVAAPGALESSPAPSLRSPIRYTVSDGLHIAYQVTGGGDLDLVLVSGFVSHLELDWADPRHAHFLDRLGSFGRLIRFDKRGTGMSDRPIGLPDLETRMHDVLAVMDAAGSRQAVLVGYSEGGPMSILFAAAHPERVSALVLYGCYAKRTWAEDYPWAQTPEERSTYTDKLVTEWDWEADLRMRCPSADPPMQRWWAQRMRAAATPTTVRALLDMNSLVDVRDALSAVRVPTLVVHRDGDALTRTEEAAYLAERIQGAELVLLPGDDHFVSGNPDQILDAIEPFLADLAGRGDPELSLAAIAVPAGPGAAGLADGLASAGGRLRTDPGGRSVVLFDGPATAVRAGLAQLSGAVRLGVAIGEVPRHGDQVAETGVRLASDLADQAPPGAVWVSSAVRDLLAGSGVVLEVAPEYGGNGSPAAYRAVGAS
ncbi:serine aminopeptidase S33 family [Kribbella amoyensis]|uniref:Serine aminopeptidase S33 family n=1 Tax=Kribbella amoyensis TaxID=996641 RepID=A0A561BV56_9ACTN|nr:alpha/beta fold hydrolase [Kribbella amoyensis]TWD82785.1 serine aminopeptidase S33 family [Kribbella amoyensis]